METRLRKASEGLDAVVLAYAGLRRLGLAAHATQVLSPEQMLPAVAQGALALEARAPDPPPTSAWRGAPVGAGRSPPGGSPSC